MMSILRTEILDALSEIAKKNHFNPRHIGKEVLELLGYRVDFSWYNYNSLVIKVFDREGAIVVEENIGL